MYCRLPPQVSYHFQFPVLYGSLYFAFLWAYEAIGGSALYTALDLDNMSSMIFTGALPVLLAISFAIMYGFGAAREACLAAKSRSSGSRNARPAGQSQELKISWPQL